MSTNQPWENEAPVKKSKLGQIMANEPFFTDGETQLDLSGCPSVQQEVNAAEPRTTRVWSLAGIREIPTEDVGAQEWREPHSGNGLKNFVKTAHRDPSLLQELARSGGPAAEAAIAELQEIEEANVAKRFLKRHPEFFKDEGYENYQLLRDYVDANCDGRWDDTTVEEAYHAVFASLQHDPSLPRDLTQAELLRISRMAQVNFNDALITYIQLSLPEDAAQLVTTSGDPFSILGNPAYADIVNNAVYFCWQSTTPDFLESQDGAFLELVNEAAAEKPLTVNMLNALWQRFKQNRQRADFRQQVRGAATPAREPEQVSERGLNDLSDEEISQLYQQTRAQVVRQRAHRR